MPAPTQPEIAKALNDALLPYFPKAEMQDGKMVVDSTVLQPAMAELATALASALTIVWTQYNSKTTVSIPVTSSPGSPSVGVLV